MGFNIIMYLLYGEPYLEHSWTYHLTRLDHRHNFSPYNTLLHLNSSPSASSGFQLERLAFLPQIAISSVMIPMALAKKVLAVSMMFQTFAFVTFNKVCTSQYFLWYLVFLPLYLPRSKLLRQPTLGTTVLIAWVIGQAAWLYYGYQLEFLGQQAFIPGLWLSSLLFFIINSWILGVLISDVSSFQSTPIVPRGKKAQ